MEVNGRFTGNSIVKANCLVDVREKVDLGSGVSMTDPGGLGAAEGPGCVGVKTGVLFSEGGLEDA
jgi:hypothetical protein